MKGQQICVFIVLIIVPNVSNVRLVKPRLSGIALKCCGVYRQFGSSGECVPASWPSADVDVGSSHKGEVSARDESWMSRWFPPGPPRNELTRNNGTVFHSLLDNYAMNSSNSPFNPQMYRLFQVHLGDYSLKTSVNQSSFSQDAKDLRNWTGYMVLRNDGYLVRQKTGNKLREAFYCVDAVEGKMAPYLLVFRTLATRNDGFLKCCRSGEVIVNKRPGHLDCEKDPRGWTNPTNASFSSKFDLETPFDDVTTMIKPVERLMLIIARFHTSPLPSDDIQRVQNIGYKSVNAVSSEWEHPCADLKRDENGRVTEVWGDFVVTRHTRTAYRTSRNMPIVTVLVLLAALVAIGCKERMRSSAHGWALCCHIVCLLFFNIGQIVFTLTMSDTIEEEETISPLQTKVCLVVAIPMYFFLTGATAWMTAVSVNIFYGFKMTGGVRAGGGDRRRFLRMSAFAWSVAAVLTGVSVAAFLNIPDRVDRDKGYTKVLAWYRPTFAETRTCFNEVGFITLSKFIQPGSLKWGTTLYYYVPTLALVASTSVFLWLTGRKVSYLRRGTSLLKRDEREGGGRRREGGGGLQKRGSADETNGVMVYIKLLLAGGVVEFLAELITWTVSGYHPLTSELSEVTDMRWIATVFKIHAFLYADHTYAHRTVGCWADLFRALVVLLVLVVAPDLRAVWRRMRGKGGDSPAQSTATGFTSRIGRQESAL